MEDIRDQMTERLLVDAGLTAGMRVLDVGCGRGDVTFMIARLVGRQGQVMGIDLDPDALIAARKRAVELGYTNITFTPSDLSALSPDLGVFDAIVGRRVLMYQSQPVEAVKALSRCLALGGRMIFQEHDSAAMADERGLFPLHHQVQQWIWETVGREGGRLHMGFDLYSVLTAAGLSVEHIRAEAVVLPPDQPYPFEAIIKAMHDRIIEKGVASEEELGLGTLGRRLKEEREQADAVFMGDMVFSAWGKK